MSKKKTTSEPPQEGLGESLPDPEAIRQEPDNFSKYEPPIITIQEDNRPPRTIELRRDSQRWNNFNFGLDYMQIGNFILTRQELIDNPDKFRKYFTGEEKVWLYVLQAAYNIHKSFSPLTKAQEKKLAEVERRLGLLNNKGSFRLGIHIVRQTFIDNKQLSLFSPNDIEEYARLTNLRLKNKPDSFGVVLNVSQMRVFEGIVKAFSKTNYKGDIEIPLAQSLKEGETGIDMSSGKAIDLINKAYKDKNSLPVVRITQGELLKLSGYDRTQKDKTECIEALDYLGSQQFCFFWKRLVYDNKGNPEKDKKSGKYAKEEVMEVGTLFRIKYVREEGGDIKYYEIHPSGALIDQIDNYFLMIPYNWREEVKQLTGNRGSKYTYQFLIWLRLKFEEIRRQNNRKGRAKPRKFEIPVTWEEIAIALGMPETIYRANRLRGKKIIDKAYSVAIKLGYLLKVEDTGAGDLLYLNEDYFPQPGDLK